MGRWIGGIVVAALLVISAAAPAAATDPPTAPAGAAASPPTVGLVGDSMLYSTFQEVFDAVTRDRQLAFQRVFGKFRIADVFDQTVAAVQGPSGPDILLVHIGTAQANIEGDPDHWEAEVRRFLDAVAPHVDCVRWFDVQTAPSGFYLTYDAHSAAYNARSYEAVRDHPNAEWVHYDAWREIAGEAYMKGDRTHPNDQGAREMGVLMRNAANGCDPALRTGPFWDVADSHWAADAIAWAGRSEVATGYRNGTFRAEIGSFPVPISRGQVLAMLWRAEGAPTGFPPHRFSDGAPWLNDALRWAAATGTASGYPDRTFRPDASISRGEMIRMLWVASGSPRGFAPHPWPDGARWLDPALDWAADTAGGAAAPLMEGYPDGSFQPGTPIDRAQLARLLHRAMA